MSSTISQMASESRVSRRSLRAEEEKRGMEMQREEAIICNGKKETEETSEGKRIMETCQYQSSDKRALAIALVRKPISR